MVGLRDKLSNYIWVEPEDEDLRQEIIAMVLTIEDYLNNNKPENTENSKQFFLFDNGAQVLFTYTKKSLLVYNVEVFIRFNTRSSNTFFEENRPQWTKISDKERDIPENTFTEHARAFVDALLKDQAIGKYITREERYIELNTHVTILDLKMAQVNSFVRIKVHNGQVYATK